MAIPLPFPGSTSVPGSTSINVSSIRNPLGNRTNPSPAADSSTLVIYADLEVPWDRINRRALITRMRFPQPDPHAAFPIQAHVLSFHQVRGTQSLPWLVNRATQNWVWILRHL